MKKVLLIAILFLGLACSNVSFAEEQVVDYEGAVVVDNDLDGLTDLGETEIFKTEPLNPDSDGDGFLDGVEVLGGTDPLDNTSPQTVQTIEKVYTSTQGETPWAWYLTRMSGLIGFFLLFLSFFFGLAIRIPILNKIIQPIYSFKIHGWISLQALIFASLHGVILIGDKLMGFRLRNIFIPFYPVMEGQMSGIDPKILALGILSFYIMVVLVLTSYFRKHINATAWRALHFLNIGLFVIVFIHALYLGTDLKNEIFRNIFIAANAFLLILIIANIILKFTKKKPIADGEKS